MGTSVGQTSKLLKDCLRRRVTDSSIVMGPPKQQAGSSRLKQTGQSWIQNREGACVQIVGQDREGGNRNLSMTVPVQVGDNGKMWGTEPGSRA